MHRRLVLGLLVALVVALSSLLSAPAAVAADRDCGDFSSQRDAQIFFLSQGGPYSDPHRLDSDGDGIACETNPAPYYYGTTPPSGGGGSDPQPQITAVRSTVHLTLEPNRRIAGESFRIKVSVQPAISRKVVVQRKVDGRWKLLGTGVTGRNGRTSGSFTSPSGDVSYRALVLPVTRGHKRFSAAESQPRTLDIQPQRLRLGFDDRTVAQGEQVLASVHATPVRAGRTVVLQMRSGSTWRTVRTSRLDRHGRATFTFTPTLGSAPYRAVATRHRGAVPVQSDIVTVTATDVTPPPVPFGLVAVPGDGVVQLSWSRVLPSDFDHHEVWMRTDDTAWSLVATTELDSVEITLLQNDVTHWFTVTSVDSYGNASDMATEVAATPSATTPGSRIAP